MTDRQFRLKDGRLLGYTEFGDPGGKPVFYFHDSPGSRLDWLLFDSGGAAADAGIRIIAADRPGIGFSHPQRNRKFTDWPDDVSELADGLGMERFSVLGISGGGPYALACAYRIPHRLESTAVVGGMGPADAPGMCSGKSWALPGRGRLSRWMFLRKTSLGVKKDPVRFAARWRVTFPERDRQLLEKPEVAEAFTGMLREAFRPGTGGVNREAALYARSWRFSPGEITCRVHLWHGEQDGSVPVSVGHYLAETIPDCEARFMPDEAHISLPYFHIQEVLDTISGSGSDYPQIHDEGMADVDDTYSLNFKRLEAIAVENGLVFNPDPERVKKVIGLMTDNYDKVREWVCPCKQEHKPPVKGRDKLCPCPEWLDEVEADGYCFCKLFFTPEKAAERE